MEMEDYMTLSGGNSISKSNIVKKYLMFLMLVDQSLKLSSWYLMPSKIKLSFPPNSMGLLFSTLARKGTHCSKSHHTDVWVFPWFMLFTKYKLPYFLCHCVKLTYTVGGGNQDYVTISCPSSWTLAISDFLPPPLFMACAIFLLFPQWELFQEHSLEKKRYSEIVMVYVMNSVKASI